MSDWKKVKLQDITSILGDGLHGTPEYTENGEYYFINGNNLNEGNIVINNDTKRVSFIEYLKYKKELNDRTLLVSINGTLGNVAYYKSEKVVLGKSACYFNLIDNIDKRFVKYILSSDYFIKYINLYATGTTIQNVSLKTMREFSFKLPELREQQQIADVLFCFDAKIENLRRQNETLEQIAQTLFKHWFIDFEFPNADGKPYKSSGGAMSPSELGDIPEGWRVGVSGEIINLQGGFAFKSDDFQDTGNHGVIKIRNISDNIVDINKTDFISDSVASKTNLKFKLSSGDILIAMTGAEVAKIGVIPKTRNSFFLNQRVGLFQEKINGGKLYIYYLFSREEYQKALRDKGSGSSAQPNISASDIEDITIIIPKLSIVEKFADITGYLFIKRCENLFQIQTLTKTRDTLLPKLMSGQLRIKE